MRQNDETKTLAQKERLGHFCLTVLRRMLSRTTRLAILGTILTATLNSVCLAIQPYLLGAAIARFTDGLRQAGIVYLGGLAMSCASYLILLSKERIGHDIARATLATVRGGAERYWNTSESQTLHTYSKGIQAAHSLIGDLFSQIAPYLVGLMVSIALMVTRVSWLSGLAMIVMMLLILLVNIYTLDKERHSS